jgi:DNA-binding NarL/FixJ family response regulator
VAEPQTQVRAALKAPLRAIPGVEVSGEAEHGRGLVEQVAVCRPGPVFSELMLPDIGGAELAQPLRRQYPGTGVTFLSYGADAVHMRLAMKALGRRGVGALTHFALRFGPGSTNQ